MGTRKSRHNKGRKPRYKDHRHKLLHDVFSSGSTTAILVEDNSFLFYPNAKRLTLATAKALTEEDAEHSFCAIRWVDGDACCPRCQSDDLYRWSRKVRRWRCKRCQFDFRVTSGTLFASHKMSWRTIMIAVAITVGADRLDKPSDMAREMGVTFKAAFTLVNRIREAALMSPLEPEARKAETFSLDHPRYKGGLWLSTRTWWTAPEKTALQGFIRFGASPAEAADALGRSPKSLAWRARDDGIVLPAQWSGIITPQRDRTKRSALAYPYIVRAKPEHADLLALNALVPRVFPEHMRADICQEMMLAVFEGKITPAEIKANREHAAWFMKKFWRDNYELGGNAISLDVAENDEGSYYAAASSLAAKEWIAGQRNEFGRHEDIMRRINPPTQIEDTYFSQVARKHLSENLAGLHITFDEAEEMLNVGSV